MKQLKSMKRGLYTIYVCVFFVLNYACNNLELNDPGGERTTVKFTIGGYNQEDIVVKMGSNQSLNLKDHQIGVLNVGGGMTIEYELKGEKITDSNPLLNADGPIISNKNNKAGLVVLPQNTKYRLLIFDTNSKLLVHNEVYTYSSTAPLELAIDAGKTYKFIVLSENSTAGTVKNISGTNLDDAVISALTSDVLFWNHTQYISHGPTSLEIVLSHKFCEVKTTLTVDETVSGNFQSAPSMNIKPAYTSANIVLKTNAMTFNNLLANGVNASISNYTTGSRRLETGFVRVIHEGTNSGTLNFPNGVSIGTESIPSFSVPVNIKPGYRYTLNLVFKTCTYIVSEFIYDKTYNPAPNGGAYEVINGVTYTRPQGYEITSANFTGSASDYGYQFDIYELDNSLFLFVNGTSLTNREIQFQSYNGNPPANTPDINVEFADGSQYCTGGIVCTYQFNFPNITASSVPAVRVIISKTGQVSMFGRKSSSNTTLYPLRFKSGSNTSFNTITWNDKATNTLMVKQRVDGETAIKIRGRAMSKTQCPQPVN